MSSPCGGERRKRNGRLKRPGSTRFGTLRPVDPTPVLRSDNGLIFQSRRFRQACRDYRLSQEFITPYTPQHNGLIERFFRSLKEECVWQHQFWATLRRRSNGSMAGYDWYNEERPHQGYSTEPSTVSTETRLIDGLISGEHYMEALASAIMGKGKLVNNGVNWIGLTKCRPRSWLLNNKGGYRRVGKTFCAAAIVC